MIDERNASDSDRVRLKVEALFELLRQPTDSASIPAADRTDETSQAWQRFRILRHHAKGGLGDVWVAFDEELNRNVALKEIQACFASHPESRSRFLREATITGQLEHPGIVPVYTIGRHDDGRPFYAMRLIQGDTLQQAIERFYKAHGSGTDPHLRQLELRKLLDRFIDVCNAVGYAHSRGIIHRDLKPANIMLGAFGETLVVDWGLAKSVAGQSDNSVPQAHPGTTADGPAPTLQGATIGTPAYMSPEQAAGRTDELGPLSDVYSLGATLYCLLTGKPPFPESDLETVLAKVRLGEFPRPRQVNSTAPAPLEAVCLKAMSLDSSSRYSTAQAIADDLQHWLADEPVSAHRDSLAVSALRFGRRHKSVMTGGSALVLTAIVALVANNHLLRKEQERTENRRLEAVDAETRAVASQKLAESNEHQAIRNKTLAERRQAVADEQRQLATSRFDLSLGAFRGLVTDVQEQLKERSGTQDVRQNILRFAELGLQSLADESAPTDSLDEAIRWCCNVLGDLYFETGRRDIAEEQFARGIRLSQKVIDVSPKNEQALHDLVNSQRGIGQVAYANGDLNRAQEAFLNAIATARRSAAISDSLQSRRDIEMLYNNLGDVARDAGDPEKAFDFYTKALEQARSLYFDSPQNEFYIQDLLVTYERLGELHLQLGNYSESDRFLGKNLDLAKQYVASNPRNLKALNFLTIAMRMMGDLRMRTGQLDTALQLFEQYRDIAARVAEDNVSNVEFLRAAAIAYDRLFTLSIKRGDNAKATEYCIRQHEISANSAKQHPDDPRLQRDLMLSSTALGKLLLAQEGRQRAMPHFTTAIEIAQRLATAQNSNPRAKYDLANARSVVGDALKSVKKL